MPEALEGKHHTQKCHGFCNSPFPKLLEIPTKPGLLQLLLLMFDLSRKGKRKKSPVFNEWFGCVACG